MSGPQVKQFSCAGCGEVHGTPYGGGLWIPSGEQQGPAVPYLLCKNCTAAMNSDPEQTTMAVEDRLLRTRGHA
jgi:hypothetical protein